MRTHLQIVNVAVQGHNNQTKFKQAPRDGSTYSGVATGY
jgi:hypothetical protein